MAETIRVRVTYNSALDTLYITEHGSGGAWGSSADGTFLFVFHPQRGNTRPSGIEIHHFSEVWDDDSLIPKWPEWRFEVIDTEVRQATLRQLTYWAYGRFIGARPSPYAAMAEVVGVPVQAVAESRTNYAAEDRPSTPDS